MAVKITAAAVYMKLRSRAPLTKSVTMMALARVIVELLKVSILLVFPGV